jgi:hypothetical protein
MSESSGEHPDDGTPQADEKKLKRRAHKELPREQKKSKG